MIKRKNSSYWTQNNPHNILKAFKAVVLPLSNEIHILESFLWKSHLQNITVIIFGVNKPSMPHNSTHCKQIKPHEYNLYHPQC